MYFNVKYLINLERKYKQSGITETCLGQSNFVFMSVSQSAKMNMFNYKGGKLENKILTNPHFHIKKLNIISKFFHYDEALEYDH